MKKFHFPLERVLSFRRTQLQVEQSKLERLMHELKVIDAKAEAVENALQDSRNAVVRSQSQLGMELEAFDDFRGAAERQTASLTRARRACLDRITLQRGVVQQKERDVKLLEKLRENRMGEWRTGQAREIDRQAEESYLARWTK